MRNAQRSSSCITVATIALCLATCSGGSMSKDASKLAQTTVPQNLVVTSSAFANDAPVPRANTCDGPGSQPSVTWSGVPATAKAVALVVDDPDAPSGDFVHWIVIGLPTRNGTVPPVPAAAHELDNTAGGRGWAPPCPPPGTVHHYRFTVYALRDDVCAPNGDEANAPGCSPPAAASALAQIRDGALAKGTLVGTYRR